MSLFLDEFNILNKLIYKCKNQHKNTISYRKLTQLKRAIRRGMGDIMKGNVGKGNAMKGGITTSNTINGNTNISNISITTTGFHDIISCSLNLYIAASRDLVMGFFIPLNTVIMALAARIHYLTKKLYKNTKRKIKNNTGEQIKNAIDDIFDKL